MNPKKASLYFAEYRRGTLDAAACAKIRKLLETNAQVRADFDADTRLEEIIGLKRYEMPKAGPLVESDAFLAEFHRRQRSELVKPEPMWKTLPAIVQDLVQDYFVTPTSALVRYSGVAAVLAVVVGLSLFYSPKPGVTPVASHPAPVTESPIANVPVVLANNMAETPVHYILQRVNTSTGDHGFRRFDF